MEALVKPRKLGQAVPTGGCIVCTSGRPYGIIADLDHTWVTTDPEVAIFGYVCVISKVHAVEPFDLPDEGAAFWLEAMAVAQVVNRLYRPVKLNYQIHGNTLPHLHMHLFPVNQTTGSSVARSISRTSGIATATTTSPSSYQPSPSSPRQSETTAAPMGRTAPPGPGDWAMSPHQTLTTPTVHLGQSTIRSTRT